MQQTVTEQHSTANRDGAPVRVFVYMSHGVTRFNIEEIKLIRQEDMDDFRDQVQATVNQIDQPNVVISFETVQLICSRLLGIIAALNKQIRARGGRLKLACVNPEIRKVFSITGLDREIKIYDSVTAAEKSFRFQRVIDFFGGPKPASG